MHHAHTSMYTCVHSHAPDEILAYTHTPYVCRYAHEHSYMCTRTCVSSTRYAQTHRHTDIQVCLVHSYVHTHIRVCMCERTYAHRYAHRHSAMCPSMYAHTQLLHVYGEQWSPSMGRSSTSARRWRTLWLEWGYQNGLLMP